VLRTAVLPGQPGRVLSELSEDASLVVVGTRGHGELVGMFVGSVGLHLLTHAHCPVVVVRSSEQTGTATFA